MKSVTVQYLEDYTYTQLLTADGHAFVADEQPDAGGDGLGPDPYDLLLWSLGSCTAMTILLYARRKGYQVSGVAVDVERDSVYAKDCEECVDDKQGHGKIDVLRRKISIRGELSEEERAKVLEIVGRCPVHLVLQSPPQVLDTISVGP